MSVRAVPIIPRVWTQLINELLQRLPSGHNLSDEDIKWASGVIADILTEIKSARIVYKDLVFMNQGSKIGRFALTFHERLVDGIKIRDESSIRKLLQQGETPEFDDNPRLSNDDRLRYEAHLNIEMNTFTLLIRRLSYNPNMLTSGPILESESHNTCKKDVCFAKLPNDQKTDDKLLMLDLTANPPVYVADQVGVTYQAMCFSLPDLIVGTVTEGINPYTEKPFSKTLIDLVATRYSTERNLVIRYLEVTGRLQTNLTATSKETSVDVVSDKLPIPE